MNGFIVIAENVEPSKNFYVSNTSPILWTGNISESKIFNTFKNAKNELEENFISLSATVSKTNICAVYIVEYRNNAEVRREQFI